MTLIKENSNNWDKGAGEEGVGENDPVQENEETVHEIEDETSTEEDDDESVHKSVHGDDPSLGSVEIVDDYDEEDEPRANDNELDHEQPSEPEEPTLPGLATDQRPPAVRKLNCLLNGEHWKDNMVGLVVHQYCIGSVIREYTNLTATLSTPTI